MKLLHKIATVIVALLLYGVIAVLQSPKVRAADEVQAVSHLAHVAQACLHHAADHAR